MTMNRPNGAFHSDFRVQAADERKARRGLIDIDPNTKTATIHAAMDGEDEATEVAFDWDVCPTCRGDGTVTDPAVDAGGISGQEMARRGPEFQRRYMNGSYDTECPRCEGRRVVPNLQPQGEEEEAAVEAFHRALNARRETDRMRRAEKAMGA
jgi:hypothetical protein